MTEKLTPDNSSAVQSKNRILNLIYTAPTLGEIKRRYDEIFSPAREEERAKRHAERVKVLTQAQNRGEIVFHSRIEIDS